MTDKQKAAAAIRALLERRIGRLLGCEPSELPHMKIGSMAQNGMMRYDLSEMVIRTVAQELADRYADLVK